MAELDTYYFAAQMKRYIIQFMAIFAGMQVKIGAKDDIEPRLIKVPCYYGAKDRVVAHILTENTQNKMIRLPTMSAYRTGIDMAPQLYKGVPTEQRTPFMPAKGVFPDDVRVSHHRMPVPYIMQMELGIYTSNTETHDQILEPIMTLFDPDVQIQTSDNVFSGSLTDVKLVSISPEQNYPPTTDRRIIQTFLNFEMPIYLTVPANIRNDFIREIYTRIGVINTATTGSEDILAELDQQGAQYELYFDLDDVPVS